MFRKTVIHAVALMFMLSLFLSLAIDNSTAMSVRPEVYHIYGRVVNQQDRPIRECNVMLIKRKISYAEEQPDDQDEPKNKVVEVTSEEIVAITMSEGNYSFVFEPLEANNFWVVFTADGYRTRSMDIDKLISGSFFLKANISPIKIDVVLEKE